MSIAEKLKKRRREEQEQHSYANSSRWYTGLSHVISFLDHAETEDDVVNRFRDLWTAADTLSQMHVERGEEDFKGFERWVTSIKEHPLIQHYFGGKADDVPLDAYRGNVARAKNALLAPPRLHELEAWNKPEVSPDKACRYFFSISRDIRNRLFHGDVNPSSPLIKKALASAAECLIPIVATAAQIIIERPVEGTTGRATAYRFFLYPFLRNSDGFFSDYYLERLFPDEELGAFPEDQAREALKFITKQLVAKETGLKQADSEETLKNWCDPALFEVLEVKPDPGVHIISEDAVFEPTLVLRRPGSSALQGEYRGKEAAKDIAALIWILPWRSTLDAVSTDPAFESVPVTEVVHGALARSAVPWALVTNGHQIRLLSKSSAHRPRCFLEADLATMVDRRGDPQAMRAFRFVLGLFSGPSLTDLDENGKTRLERVAIGSERHGKEIGDELKQNVYSALEELGEGFLDYLRSHQAELDGWAKRKETDLPRERFLASDELLEDIYHESLSLMYRLLFLFYAESRGLLPLDDEVYQTYSLEALRDDVHSVLDDPDPRAYFAKGNTDLWQRLKDLFRFLDKGWGNIIPAYNGGLFDPKKHEFLERFAVGDQYLARAIDLLSRTRPRAGQSHGEGRKKVTYRDLDVRHLGSIYEGILEYSAHIADQGYVVVKTGSGRSAAEDYVAVSELTREQKQQLAAWREAIEENPNNPSLPRGCKVTGFTEKGQYYLAYGGRESKRKSSGSYYTPDYIVQYIVENTLGPLVRGECRRQPEPLSEGVERALKKIGAPEERRRTGPLTSDEILELKILDPAMGSGHFLVAATEFLARAYREACIREGKTPDEAGSEQEFIRAKRIIAERCIYGVDLNLMAVELAKLSMWLFTMDRGRPLSFLDHHLKRGNALIGAWIRDLGQLPEFDRSGKPVLAEDTGQGNLFEQQFRLKLPMMLKDIFGIMKKETLTFKDIEAKKALDGAVEELKQPFVNIANVWTASLLGTEARDYLSILGDSDLARRRHCPPADTQHYFHWELEFPELWFDRNGAFRALPGFDAVIGNPPYYLLQGREEQRTMEKLNPAFYSGSDDILYYFLHLQVRLLRQGGGRGTFIVSRYWTESSNADTLREFISRSCSVRRFVDFRNFQPFGQDVSVISCMAFLERSASSLPATVVRFEDFFAGDEAVAEAELRTAESFDADHPRPVCVFQKNQQSFGKGPWFLSPNEVEELLRRIDSNAVHLGRITRQTQGIKTGFNAAFIVSAEEAAEYSLEKELLLKLAKGKDLFPFQVLDVDSFLIYTHSEVDIDAFPKVKRHLTKYRRELEGRAECSEGLYPWWRLQRPRDPRIILAPKILTPLYATFNRFALSLEVPYAVGVTDSIAFIVDRPGLSEGFITGILNSVVGQFYHKRRSKLKRANYYEYIVEVLDRFPIPQVEQKIEATVEAAATPLARLQFGSEKWLRKYQELNEAVFSLYGFKPREIRLITALAGSLRDSDAAN